MMGSVMHLASTSVSRVFRIDAVPYIWKQRLSMPQCRRSTPSCACCASFLECVCLTVVLKGEVVIAWPQGTRRLLRYARGPECHMLYNVSIMVNLWSAFASRDVRLLKNPDRAQLLRKLLVRELFALP